MKTKEIYPGTETREGRLRFLSELCGTDPETGSFTWMAPRCAELDGMCGRKVLRFATKSCYQDVFAKRYHLVLYQALGIVVPEGCHVDHVDQNPTNDRLCNLRVVSRSANAKHRAGADEDSFSGIRGVAPLRRKGQLIGWQCYASDHDGRQHLSYFGLSKHGDRALQLAADRAAQMRQAFAYPEGAQP